jgi:hypothetical protein
MLRTIIGILLGAFTRFRATPEDVIYKIYSITDIDVIITIDVATSRCRIYGQIKGHPKVKILATG